MGKVAFITRDLYSGKISSRELLHLLRMCVEFWGFVSSLVDPDVWRHEVTKSNVSKYYDYVMLCKDDLLVLSGSPGGVLLEEIGKHFALREDLIGLPSQ